LFHDTHHRALTDPKAMARLDLRDYDGVLAFGRVVRDQYLAMGWAQRAWTWHEAADTRVFYPMAHDHHRGTGDAGAKRVHGDGGEDAEQLVRIGAAPPAGDLVWVGNWGDGERSVELTEFLLRPVRRLKLRATVYGVRYPATARRALARARVEYGGWLPNHRVPGEFGRFRVTIHVPRRPYARILPGIPTIRVYEALACGIPLVSAPWEDAEGLFTPGEDFLMACDGEEMARHVAAVLADRDQAAALSAHGLATIRARHTCAHRVDELLAIVGETNPGWSGSRCQPTPCVRA
jgi:spore maturation protein CgeB